MTGTVGTTLELYYFDEVDRPSHKNNYGDGDTRAININRLDRVPDHQDQQRTEQ
jgi:hypothetical protein